MVYEEEILLLIFVLQHFGFGVFCLWFMEKKVCFCFYFYVFLFSFLCLLFFVENIGWNSGGVNADWKNFSCSRCGARLR
jgi:hypothetical protein